MDTSKINWKILDCFTFIRNDVTLDYFSCTLNDVIHGYFTNVCNDNVLNYRFGANNGIIFHTKVELTIHTN